MFGLDDDERHKEILDDFNELVGLLARDEQKLDHLMFSPELWDRVNLALFADLDL